MQQVKDISEFIKLEHVTDKEMNEFIYTATSDLYILDAFPADFDMMEQRVKEIIFSIREKQINTTMPLGNYQLAKQVRSFMTRRGYDMKNKLFTNELFHTCFYQSIRVKHGKTPKIIPQQINYTFIALILCIVSFYEKKYEYQ
ncbi:unnamed protein product [Cunninghamella echinulata]